MKKVLGVVVAFAMIGAGAAFAHTVTTTPSANANPPALSTTSPSATNAAAPVAGANSFTEDQARSRIEAHGYTNVTKLVEDRNSIWRGKATKGGASLDVALDYQGNIVANRLQ